MDGKMKNQQISRFINIFLTSFIIKKINYINFGYLAVDVEDKNYEKFNYTAGNFYDGC